MIQKIVSFLVFIFSFSVLQGVVINFPGRYELGGDVYANATDDAITITSNGVTLEMNAHSIIGGNHAIVVESGVQGVVIQNGFISNTAQSAILVKDNTAIVQIRHVSIANCNGPAIELAGTSTAAQVTNVFIEETAMNECALAVTASTVFSAHHVCDLALRNSVINFSGNLSNTINLAEINNSDSVVLSNLLFAHCSGALLRGIVLDNSKECLCEQVRLLDNVATTTFTGFLLTHSADSNGFNLCKVITGSSNTGNTIGYDVDGSSRNIFQQCEASSLEGENAYGFYMHGSGTPSNTSRNRIDSCTVSSNKALTGNAYGILISRADESCVHSSVFCNHEAPNGIAAGILFQSGTGGDGWMIAENEMAHNMGMDDANSYGVNLVTGSQNLFLKNVTFENGNTLANQLAGISANSVSLVSHDLINTVSLPWTNIGVAS